MIADLVAVLDAVALKYEEQLAAERALCDRAVNILRELEGNTDPEMRWTDLFEVLTDYDAARAPRRGGAAW